MTSDSIKVADPIIRITGKSPKRDMYIQQIVSVHLATISYSPSARSGGTVLQKMYLSLANDSSHHVVLAAIEGDDRCIGYASGSIAPGKVTSSIMSSLNFIEFLKLLFFNLLDCKYFLAKWIFDREKKSKNSGYIFTIGRIPTKKGIVSPQVNGSLILSSLERNLKNLGAKEVWVDTMISNKTALEFYDRNGYELKRSFLGHGLLKKEMLLP